MEIREFGGQSVMRAWVAPGELVCLSEVDLFDPCSLTSFPTSQSCGHPELAYVAQL